ncbi:mannose-specific lectin-like [Zingiber officinale]|uniref:mannose-specific lectin-like n=1 Tax=Zingiber officinale TaxID=94328 RepID=UPI001C4C4504|nr:mannose-specific lectin-like [Zingiber officinale]XP_042386866.1 mannose-specific lectin-like [Zingiber officinale]
MAALVTLSAAAVLLGLLLPSAMANNNVLYRGDKLLPGESLTEGTYEFIMQDHCELGLYDNGNDNRRELWSFQLVNGRACYAVLDNEGYFRIVDENGDNYTFNTSPGSILVLQRDGHVVIYSDAVWTIPEGEPRNRKIAMVTKN